MEYTYIRSKRKTIGISIEKDGSVILRAPYWCSKKEALQFLFEKQDWIERTRERVMEEEKIRKFYSFSDEELNDIKRRAKIILPSMVRDIAGQMGEEYGRVTIRAQKSRWGSCSLKKNLNFNCLLILLPENVQRYVIVHELCHLKEMNHSKAFWREVAKYQPTYKEDRKQLNSEGRKLINRL
ncbi:MAG: M48 family metallopeptidase [Lachnospiraceae bacterium]|nr:M48 family metallopeptidase [Lachnospiraceae bacterium]